MFNAVNFSDNVEMIVGALDPSARQKSCGPGSDLLLLWNDGVARLEPSTNPWMSVLLSNNPRARTESLRTKVSVAGKRNFQGRDKEAETASKVRARHRRDKVSLNNPANSGLVSENQEISVCGLEPWIR
jgi:hypothetical protein